MVGVDPDVGNSALRLWVAAGSAALLVVVCARAVDWTRKGALVRGSVIVLGVVVGATMAWAFLAGASVRDQSVERRALELRAAELSAQALAPGSSLACLDGLAGESVEVACEKAIFAAPATVAAASSYVAARLTLLADLVAYTRRGGTDIDSALLPLRRSLETDRFGFVAHTLAVRDGCSSANCKALDLLRDSSRVRANLSGATLDRYLDHYLTAWSQSPDVPVADATAPPSAATSSHKVAVDIDFPDAASIPPVSIMNPEPKGPVVPGAAAAAAADPTGHAAVPAAPPRKSRKQVSNPPSQAVAVSPPASVPPVDPVWTAGTASALPSAAAAVAPAAASVAPAGAAGPVQLNPFPAQPEANAGGTARTQ
jgi:hypothetical protein